MQLQVSDLKPNPFRRIKRYPIDREKVESLKSSISETSFWDNILARKQNGEYQIAYGHHRLVALQELGVESVNIPVRKLSDPDMLRIMANENLDSWGTRPAIAIETVLAVKEYLDKCLQKYVDLAHVEEFFNMIFATDSQFQNCKKNGVGRTAIKKFLGKTWEDKGWAIQQALVVINDNRVDRKSVEKLRTIKQAATFRSAVVKYKLPKADQKAIATEIAKEGISYRQIEEKVRDYAEAIGTTPKSSSKEKEKKRLEAEAAEIGKDLSKVYVRLLTVQHWMQHAVEGYELSSFRRAATDVRNILAGILGIVGEEGEQENETRIKVVG